MTSIVRKALSVIGVTAAVAAGVSVGGGVAMAGPPKCTATLQPGEGCLAVNNKTGKDYSVHSFRIDGRCMTGTAPGRTSYWGNHAIRSGSVGSHQFRFYAGKACEGNSEVHAATWGEVRGVDENKYVRLTLIIN
jgi:hypothetical protein